MRTENLLAAVYASNTSVTQSVNRTLVSFMRGCFAMSNISNAEEVIYWFSVTHSYNHSSEIIKQH